MSDALKTLAYRYRLRLTPAQEDMLDRSQAQLRRVWNHWVRSQRHAEREWTHGRAASVKNELLELALAKNATGQALVSARKLVLERGVSEPEALGFMRQEFVEKVATIPRRKQDGSRCLRLARRRWATRYADEIVNAKVDHYFGLGSWTYNALRDKFQKCSGMDPSRVSPPALQTEKLDASAAAPPRFGVRGLDAAFPLGRRVGQAAPRETRAERRVESAESNASLNAPPSLHAKATRLKKSARLCRF